MQASKSKYYATKSAGPPVIRIFENIYIRKVCSERKSRLK